MLVGMATVTDMSKVKNNDGSVDYVIQVEASPDWPGNESFMKMYKAAQVKKGKKKKRVYDCNCEGDCDCVREGCPTNFRDTIPVSAEVFMALQPSDLVRVHLRYAPGGTECNGKDYHRSRTIQMSFPDTLEMSRPTPPVFVKVPVIKKKVTK